MYSFFDHTGDIGMRLQAATLDGLFASAAEALGEVLVDPTGAVPDAVEVVTLPAAPADLLLVDWLNELVYRFETRQFLPRTARVTLRPAPEGWALEAEALGERLDPARHGVKVLVKAVTYHRLETVETPDGWRATVVLDI